MKVVQSCPTLCDSHGLYSPWNSPGQNTGVGNLSLLQGNLPDPGIKLGSLALQADFLPAELLEKPKNTGVGSLSLLQWNLFNPGMEPRSPALQADSLQTEPPGKPTVPGKSLKFIIKESNQDFAGVRQSSWGISVHPLA